MQPFQTAVIGGNWQHERDHPAAPRPGLALLLPILALAVVLWYLRFGRKPNTK